ncbi:MAG: response regulator [Chloroflexota bacterium]
MVHGETARPSGCPILVIDDDPTILSLVTEILRDEGYPVHTATNGREGLATLDGTSPRVVLLDMRMPVLDGWGFAHAFHERGCRAPLVVMTAARDAQRWAEEVGATASLAKPFGVDDLLGTVERLCADYT